MSALKKLVGQTAIYGIPSILGRFLNYLLVYLHTSTLQTSEYGIYNDLFTYVAFFVMIYAFGMETTFFRFSSKSDAKEAYQNAGTFVLLLSSVITILLIFLSTEISNVLGYPGHENYVIWLSIILWIDAIVAIPFARLRYQNKAIKFAALRFSNVILTILFQIFFLYLCPKIYNGEILPFLKPFIDVIYKPDYGVEYIIISTLLANSLFLIALFKDILQIKFKLNMATFKPMFWYALPITITGLAGITNERVDIIMLGNLVPDGFYPGLTSRDIQGIYGASVKLSVLMIMGTQAFRFAAEPFFFARSEDKQAPELFAKVFYYFSIAAIFIFVGVSINKEFIAFVLLRSPEYRMALNVVPLLLVGKFLFFVFTNFAIWYKVTDKTIYGTYFQIVGAIITISLDIILIPKLGYMAPAYTGIATYLVMAALCYYYGQRHFPIPYNIKGIFSYLVLAIVFVLVMTLWMQSGEWWDYGLRLLITVVAALMIFFVERKNLITTGSNK